ncbi:hypothetical protein GPB2148_1960 [marine gamma proteobacterium HTCC2148]|nr:hypothetical protein GPB2148_1960 [marine gamma proteobacterium HTCC2148]
MLLILFTSIAISVQAGWQDLLNELPDSAKDVLLSNDAADAAGVTAISSEEMIAGLKEALNTASALAVNSLGEQGGFLDNPTVRIPMPEELSWIEKGLRQAGQQDMADEFVITINRAAEQAVPLALDQFQSAIANLTVKDAEGILYGSEDAATKYFRKHSESTLRDEFLPIVQQTTSSAGVTSTYQDIMRKVGSFSSFLQPELVDLDQYVTDKALDGLFAVVAQEEKRIRDDPVARSSELLKKVFDF